MRKIAFFLFIFTQMVFSAQRASFTILTFNDVYDIVHDSVGRGGFAELTTLLHKERAESRHCIVTMNGDFLSPSLLSSFDKGAHRIQLFNAMGIDVVVVGNHEFDFGPDEVLKRVQESRFPWLGANAIGLDGKPFTGSTQTIIQDVDGIKVGFFGLITVETPNLSSTGQKVCFLPLVHTAKQKIAELKALGADVIVALTHLHMTEDRKLAEEVPEIDVILGGHDHEPETYYNGKTFVHKSGMNGYYLTKLELFLEKDEETQRTRVFPSWNVILNKDIAPDPAIGCIVEDLQSTLEKVAGDPIGIVGMAFDTFSEHLRSSESKFANFVADALREYCHADMGFLCGGIIRGNQRYKEGDGLTIKDILRELPFQNTCVTVEVSGATIVEALENGISRIETRAGRFPQVSGVQFAYDPNREAGSRICEVYVQGKPLDPDALYTVATIDYVLHGGDGYEMFKSGKVSLSPLEQIALVDVVVDKIREVRYVGSLEEGRISRKKKVGGLDDLLQ